MIARTLITTSPFTIPAAYYEHIGHEFNRHVQMSLLYTCKINILEKRNNKVVYVYPSTHAFLSVQNFVWPITYVLYEPI